MESLKRGTELSKEARDWYALKLMKLAKEHGCQDVTRAIDECLEDLPFRPDISEIKKAMGISAAQVGQVDAAATWPRLLAHLRKYAESDERGRWALKPKVRIVRTSGGEPVMVEDARGRMSVLSEKLPMPQLSARELWAIDQVGGLGRIMDCDDAYVEILRKDFLRAWPLYTAPGASEIESGEEDVRGLLAGALDRLAMRA